MFAIASAPRESVFRSPQLKSLLLICGLAAVGDASLSAQTITLSRTSGFRNGVYYVGNGNVFIKHDVSTTETFPIEFSVTNSGPAATTTRDFIVTLNAPTSSQPTGWALSSPSEAFVRCTSDDLESGDFRLAPGASQSGQITATPRNISWSRTVLLNLWSTNATIGCGGLRTSPDDYEFLVDGAVTPDSDRPYTSQVTVAGVTVPANSSTNPMQILAATGAVTFRVGDNTSGLRSTVVLRNATQWINNTQGDVSFQREDSWQENVVVCYTVAPTDRVGWTGSASTHCVRRAPVVELRVNRQGNSSGNVVSNPAGISCNTDCSEFYAVGTNVRLTATPAANTTVEWAGCNSVPSPNVCEVDLNGNRTITATFNLVKRQLTVTRTGSGTVTSNPSGINCGVTCTAQYDHGTQVTLTAVPPSGSSVTWNGCDTHTGNQCSVSMNGNRSVSAGFTVITSLSVVRDGNSAGTVTSSPAGINCGSVCSAQFSGTVVLSATPAANTSVSWSECDGTNGNTCTVNVSSNRTVRASFNLVRRMLTIIPEGTGTGTVVSNLFGIDCGSVCNAQFDHGTGVTLTASPASNATVTWIGCDTSNGNTCNTTMTGDRTVRVRFTAAPPPPEPTLTVTRNGTGSGTVTSNPAGINCGTACSAPMTGVVTLTATPAANSSVTWTGCDTSDGNTCTVSMTADRAVTATFNLTFRTLTVTTTGTGSGSVTSSPAGIDCGNACTTQFQFGTNVTLSATPASSTTVSWTGCDTTNGNACNVAITSNREVTATFTAGPPPPPPTPTLTVAKAGNGTGTVTSSPAGIDCGTACSAQFNGTVELFAAPSANTAVTWSGCDTSSGNTCTVTVNSNRIVTARFEVILHTLIIARNGNGTGTVTSTPTGIDCGTVCNAQFNGEVVLTATPAANTEVAWSGCDSSNGNACTVDVASNRTVTASFNLIRRSLTVVHEGTGTGIVTSNPAGIECGNVCHASFDHGTTIALTALPAPNTTVVWVGCDTSSENTCGATVDRDRTVRVTFTAAPPPPPPPPPPTLTVTRNGAGQGTINSNPEGINCGSVCSAQISGSVTLTATPAANSNVTWAGCDTSSGNTCTVNMTESRTVTATFSLIVRTLTVTRSGNSSGSVTSDPNGIACGNACSAEFQHGINVILTATPAANTTVSWTGCDTTNGNACSVAMTSNRAVTATFTAVPQPATLTVAKAGNGTGTVTSNPAGINCGATCSALFNGSVILTATPGSNTTMSWSGCDSTNGNTCTVNVTANRTVTATFQFTPVDRTLTVTTAGNGTGVVSSAPVGINCGSTCSAAFPENTAVVLTATPSAGSTFVSWSGCDVVTAGACQIALNGNRSVAATFNAIEPAEAELINQIFGAGTVLTASQVQLLDDQGNRNGRFDIGDLRAWLKRNGRF